MQTACHWHCVSLSTATLLPPCLWTQLQLPLRRSRTHGSRAVQLMPLVRHAQLSPCPATQMASDRSNCNDHSYSLPLLLHSRVRSSSAPVSGPAGPHQFCQRALLPGLLKVLISRAGRICVVLCHSSPASADPAGSPKCSSLPLATHLKLTNSARPLKCSPCHA